MLIEQKPKLLFLSIYATLICLQFYSAVNHQLFGDEAFYWLESQHLAWSYAELPGWTQWSIAFSQWLFPKHEMTVRLPGLLAAWSLPWLGMSLVQKLGMVDQKSIWLSGLLLLTLPLLAVAGFMALPDIWLIFFGVLSVWAFCSAIQTNQTSGYLLLGLVLAIGINTHVRFWIIVLSASLVIFWQFRNHKTVIIRLLTYSFPVMVLGFIPVLIFNMQHDFALLSFQLDERHPWEFQVTHFNFFPTQILVATPLVVLLCVVLIKQMSHLNRLQKSCVWIALLHWLIYAFIGFFSDNLRFNSHWTIFSYYLLLVVAGSTTIHKKLKSWTVISGVVLSFAAVILLYHALHTAQPVSKLNAQLTENFRGWEELATKTTELIATEPFDFITADQFMTLAALKFYADPKSNITSLTHPANIKHGREQQLNFMGYLQEKTTAKGLLIAEHSALKLEQMIPFYYSACETLGGIQLIDTFSYSDGVKTYHFFKTGGGQCELPPISYLQPEKTQLNGWVVVAKGNIPIIKLSATTGQATLKSLGDNHLFQALDSSQYQLIEFNFDNIPTEGPYQVEFNFSALTVLSSRIVPD